MTEYVVSRAANPDELQKQLNQYASGHKLVQGPLWQPEYTDAGTKWVAGFLMVWERPVRVEGIEGRMHYR
jgi:hypothetical protein